MADSSTRNRKTTGCLTTIAEARRLAAARRERTLGLESNPIEISSDSDNSSDDDSDSDVVLVGSYPGGRPLIPLDMPVGAPKDHDRNSKPVHMKTTTEKPTSKSVNALPETNFPAEDSRGQLTNLNALPGGSQPESATVAQSYNSEDAGPPTNFPKGRRIVSQTREGTNDPDMLVSSSGRKRSAETELSRALSSDSDIPLAPLSKKSRLLSRMASGSDDEHRLEAVQAERSPRFQISPSRSSFDEQQPDSDLQTESATPVSQPSFGLANIIGKDKPRKGHGFTLKDVVPDQRPKGVNSNSTTQQLKGFYDSLRASFPPVVVGPDYIQHGPSKKGTLTLGDVTNTGTLEPLFDVQHAIDQHKARGDGGSAGRKTDIRE